MDIYIVCSIYFIKNDTIFLQWKQPTFCLNGQAWNISGLNIYNILVKVDVWNGLNSDTTEVLFGLWGMLFLEQL